MYIYKINGETTVLADDITRAIDTYALWEKVEEEHIYTVERMFEVDWLQDDMYDQKAPKED